jgi:hypothetical protein
MRFHFFGSRMTPVRDGDYAPRQKRLTTDRAAPAQRSCSCSACVASRRETTLDALDNPQTLAEINAANARFWGNAIVPTKDAEEPANLDNPQTLAEINAANKNFWGRA